MSPGLPAHSLPGSLAETENLPACGSASEHVSVHATMHAVCMQLRLYTHASRRACVHCPVLACTATRTPCTWDVQTWQSDVAACSPTFRLVPRKCGFRKGCAHFP